MAIYPLGRSYVQAAVDAVLKAALQPVDMAYFGAREAKPAAYCQQQVRQSAVYLAVVGFRYGSHVPDRADGVSYTELEFLTATEAGIPRLVFLLSEDAPLPPRLVDRDRAAVDRFRARLQDAGVVVQMFTTPGDLGEAVLHALYEERRTRRRSARGTVDGDDGKPDAGGPRRPWMAPALDRMVERPELGDRLLAALIAPQAVEVGLTTSLHGAGGFGKTTLATWVSHRPEIDRRYPGGMLWVTLGQEVYGAELAQRINDLAFVLSRKRPAISDPDAAGAELGRLLDQRPPTLLVVDDVWRESQLRPFRIGGRLCTRLITTRIPNLLSAGPSIKVDMMSGDEASQLVAGGMQGMSTDVVDRLAVASGLWPVLLNLVNGALRRRTARGQPPDQAGGDILDLLATRGPAALDPARPSDRAQAVAATVDASLALMESADQQRYLDLAAFPQDVDIPLDVLTLLWPDCRIDAVCEELVGLGLVADYRLDHPGPRLVLHDVIRAYLRSRRSADELANVHRRLVSAAVRLLPLPDEDEGKARGDSVPPSRTPLLSGTLEGPAVHAAGSGGDVGAHREDGLTRSGEAHSSFPRLPPSALAGEAPPWWRLPDDSGYLWRFLPHHMHEAGMRRELAALTCDLRWVESKIRRFGSVVAVEADLALVDSSASRALKAILGRSAHLLGPIDPPGALGATLASRLHGVPDVREALDRYRATLPRPWIGPIWPLPDHGPHSADAGHIGAVASCAFSPDSALLATTSDDGTARLWRVPSRKAEALLAGHTGAVWGCAFSPDGQILATVSNDGTARLWATATGAVQAVLGHAESVTSCAFSPDGALLAVGSNDGVTRLWQLTDCTIRTTLTGHTNQIWGCAFSPDGALLATASSDGTARLWQVADGRERQVLTGHARRVCSCAFSPDGTLLATTSGDGTARLWQVADGTERAVLTGHTTRVWHCDFSPDGTLLATVSGDGTIRLWQVADGAERAVLTGHVGGVLGCAFSPDGTLLATTSIDETVRLWQTGERWAQETLSGSPTRLNRCAFSPDGALAAATSIDGTAQLLEVPEGTVHAVLTGHTESVRGCGFSPDGAVLATASNDRTARLWNVADGTERAVLSSHTDWVRACGFSPDGTVLVTASNDRTVRFWRTADSSERAVLIGHADIVTSCAFTPDGALLATTSSDRTVRLWNVADGTERAVLSQHTDVVNSCAFSPDGSLLATVSDDRTVRLWHVADGSPRAVLTGHTSWVEGCAFSPDGSLLVTVGNDRNVRMWRVASGQCCCALRLSGPLGGVAWHRDTTTLFTVGAAGAHLLTFQP